MKRALVLVVIALQALVFMPARSEPSPRFIFTGRLPTFSTSPTAAPTRRAFLPGDFDFQTKWPSGATWCPVVATALGVLDERQPIPHGNNCAAMERVYMNEGDTLVLTNLDDREHSIVSNLEICFPEPEDCAPAFYTPQANGQPYGTVAPTESIEVAHVEQMQGSVSGRTYSFFCFIHEYMTGAIRVLDG